LSLSLWNPSALKRRDAWLRFFTYALFSFSAFSIAGIEAAAILLLATALVERWRGGAGAWAGLPPWLWGPFVGLAAAAFLSAAVNPGFWHTVDNMRGEYRLALPFALAAALARLDLRRLLRTHLAFMALMAVYGAIQYRYGVDWLRAEGHKLTTPALDGAAFHAQGNFSHHLTFAGVMLIVVPLYLSLALQARGWARLPWAAGALLAALATVLSLGRSGWLGMAVAVLALLALRLPRRWGVGVAALGVGALALLTTLLVTRHLGSEFNLDAERAKLGGSTLLLRLTGTSLTRDVGRLRLWEAGALAVRDRPWLGVGMGNQDRDLEPYFQIVRERHPGYVFDNPASAGLHDIYLQIAFNLGAVGLAAYWSVWGAVFVWIGGSLRRAGPGDGFLAAILAGAACGLAGSMVAGLFENNFLDGEVQTQVLLMMGLALYAGLQIRRKARGPLRRPHPLAPSP
jgi:O-antigen ligase